MPFKSEAQRRFMYAEHPVIAARWQRTYGQGKLPARLTAKKAVNRRRRKGDSKAHERRESRSYERREKDKD